MAILSLSLTFRPAQAQGGQHPARPNVVAKYIEAIQKRDFKTIIDLTLYYQQEVADIKAQNPQAVWPKLIGEYYQSHISKMSKPAEYWQSYSEDVGAMTGDPARSLRSAEELFPATCKWTISETRRQHVVSQWDGRQFEQETHYVAVDYPSWEDAPLIENKLLAKTIVQIVVHAGAGLILGVERVAAADTTRQEPFRISSLTWNQFNDLSMSVTVAGGAAPFSCTIQIGPFRTGQDCYQPGAKALHAEFKSQSIGRPPWPVRLQVRDSQGRTDEASLLVPGFLPGMGGSSLYEYCWVRDPWLQRGLLVPDNPQNCKDGVHRLGESAGEMATLPSAVPTSPPSTGEPSAPHPTPASCGDYRACMNSGLTALRGRNWEAALEAFQAASGLDPSKPDAWVGLGLADLPLGRDADLPASWDNVFRRGGHIGFGVWHELPSQNEKGMFVLSVAEIAFVNERRERVFAVPPAQVAGLWAGKTQSRALFRLRVAGTDYSFDFLPIGLACQLVPSLQCPPEAITQQLTVGNYVTQTIPKLASGSLAFAAQPPAPPNLPSAPAAPPSTPAGPISMRFAYAKSDGTALLAAPTESGTNTPIEKPGQFDTAICSDNVVLSISFDRHQEGGPNDNGRDSAQNFDQHAGDRFRVTTGRAPADGSCLLSQRAFLSGKRPLRIQKEPKAVPCDSPTVSQLAAKEKRGVHFCRRFATLAPDGQLLIVEFDRQGNDLLAEMTLKIGGQMLVDKLPAKYDVANASGWHAGDQGHLFDLSSQNASLLDTQVVSVFTPIFAIKDAATGGVDMGISWAGEEGVNLMVLSSSQGKLEEVAKGYRYMAPI
jgi:hypothetical protein